MIGLLGRKNISPQEALIISRCNSIHMFFMRFSIDAIFVDRNHCVVGLTPEIKPFHVSPIFFKSNYVIEVAAGIIVEKKISVGDQIEIQKED